MPRISKYIIRLKQVARCVIVFLCLFYGKAYALGLGKLEVQSNLDEVLKLKIELIANANEELTDIDAVIASREDFSKIGAFYPEYLKTVKIQMVTDKGAPYLLMTSKQIIKEPFIHFLVRVNWAGGSLLREYTALIDPPIYASEAPQPVVTPKIVDKKVENISSDESQKEAYEASDENEPTEENLLGDDASELQQTPEPSYEPDVSGSDDVDAAYGPVESGETLSEIAAGLQQQFPKLSMYQIMYVLFQENRTAFIDDNINGLLKGAVLKISSINKIRSTTMGDATGLFTEHVAKWQAKTGYIASVQPQELKVSQEQDDPVIFDDETISEAEQQTDEDVAEDVVLEEEPQVEEVEPVVTEAVEDGAESFVIGSSDDTQAGSSGASNEGEVLALENEISELQSTIESGNLEKSELQERVSILEAQLGEVNRLMAMEVEDADLANLQNNQNLADDAEQIVEELVVDEEIPIEETLQEVDELKEVAEDSNAVETADQFEGVSDELEEVAEEVLVEDVAENTAEGVVVEDSVVENEEEFKEVEELSEVDDEQIVPVDEQQEAESRVIPIEDSEAPQQPVVINKQPVSPQQPESFVDMILSRVGSALDVIKKTFTNLGSGILSGGDNFAQILGGFGVLLLSILGLVVYRNKKALEEFEISMMSIGSDSQISSRSANIVAGSGGDSSSSLESSFLTVYSESKGVVAADEIDPVAEADVYIAYGRDEQAEDVLKEGIQKHPERADIKLKLLKLYKRNKDTVKFERLAEELYPTDDSGKKVWQKVVSMGKTLSPNNPLFASDIVDMTAGKPKREVEAEFEEDIDDNFGKTAVLKTAVLPKAEVKEINAEETAGMSVSDTIAVDGLDESPDAIDLINDDVDEIDVGGNDNQISFDTDDLGIGDQSNTQSINNVDTQSINTNDTQSMNSADTQSINTASDAPANDTASASATLELNLEEVNLEFEDEPEQKADIEINVVDEDIDLNLQSQEIDDDAFGELTIEVESEDDASTQIELAKVFVDLGDSEGAKKILDEIIANGDQGQKADAEALLATIE